MAAANDIRFCERVARRHSLDRFVMHGATPYRSERSARIWTSNQRARCETSYDQTEKPLIQPSTNCVVRVHNNY